MQSIKIGFHHVPAIGFHIGARGNVPDVLRQCDPGERLLVQAHGHHSRIQPCIQLEEEEEDESEEGEDDGEEEGEEGEERKR